ncbi:MAG: hypothetical protein ACE5EC_02140 [Phycisphaerae bacterium]
MHTLIFRCAYVAIVILLSRQAVHADVIYWLDHSGHKVRAVDLDGSDACIIQIAHSYPQGLAVNISARTVYWTVHPRLVFANWGGRGAVDLSQDVRSGMDITLDESSGKIYWGENYIEDGVLSGRIKRSDLDGSNVEELLSGSEVVPLALEIDPVAEKVYWTDRGNGDFIKRANFDGSDIETIIYTFSRSRGLAIDTIRGKLYWTFDGNGAIGVTGGINRSNLDGTGIESLWVGDGGAFPGLTLNLDRTKLYLGGGLFGSIFRMNVNGSDFEDLEIRYTGFVSDLAIVPITPDLAGDLNWDGDINGDDIEPFIGVLLGSNATDCNIKRADMNDDGVADTLDVHDFVACLLNANCR